MKINRNIRPATPAVGTGNILLACLLLNLGLFLTACQQRATEANVINPTGVYTLVTVNGLTLPATVSHGEDAIKVQSGLFTINADGTCSSKIIFGPPSGDPFTREVDATYTQKGKKLLMQWKGAGKTTGNVEDNNFTMVNEGMEFAYEK